MRVVDLSESFQELNFICLIAKYYSPVTLNNYRFTFLIGLFVALNSWPGVISNIFFLLA